MDHPHACGDKAKVKHLQSALIGSSPRVWGQVRGMLKLVGEVRIIPTRVGTRIKEKLNALGGEDHPHACGDKSAILSGYGWL